MAKHKDTIRTSLTHLPDGKDKLQLMVANRLLKEATSLLLRLMRVNDCFVSHDLKKDDRRCGAQYARDEMFLTHADENPTSPINGWVFGIRTHPQIEVDLLGLANVLEWDEQAIIKFIRHTLTSMVKRPRFFKNDVLRLARKVLPSDDSVLKNAERTVFLRMFRDPHQFQYLESDYHLGDSGRFEWAIGRFQEFGFTEKQIKRELLTWIHKALVAWKGDFYPTVVAAAVAHGPAPALRKLLRSELLPLISRWSLSSAFPAFTALNMVGAWDPGDEELLLTDRVTHALAKGHIGMVAILFLEQGKNTTFVRSRLKQLGGSSILRSKGDKQIAAIESIGENFGRDAFEKALEVKQFGIASALAMQFTSIIDKIQLLKLVQTALDLEQPIRLGWSHVLPGYDEG